MKIAYLIIAHDQPRQFKRMIKALDSEYVSFFVHIDSKRNISEFSCPNFKDNVIFIKNRISVIQGGFSLTQAMINLMKKASILNEFDYSNSWPSSSMAFPRQNMVFYYKIRNAKEVLKQGTITVIR